MSKYKNFLAFDLGASNGRAILGRFDGKRMIMEELHRFENHYIEMNGVFYWDTPYLFDQLKQGLLAFRQGGYGELTAFGIDTWGVDYGLLDKNGHLAGVPRSYRLGTQEDVDAVKAQIPADVLYTRSGIDTGLTFNTLYQLYRRKREGDSALEIADTMLLTPDLLGYFLTGAKGTEYTIATTTQLYDPVKKDWDWETIRQLGLPEHIFTKIDKTGTVRGYLRQEICEELGINPAAFVAVGSHDTASSVAAIPGTGSFAFCSSGTWSLVGVETDTPVLTQEAAEAGFSNEGTIQGGFRPLRNIVGMWIIQECRRDWKKQGKDLSWDDIVREASQAAPFRSIIDTDSPEFYAGGNMENKIREYCKKTGQPEPETVGQVARCFYESLALKYRNVLENLETMKGQRIDSLNIVGGGCQNRLLNQMAADAMDRDVITGPVEGAALGNLLTQAMAMGDITNLEELRQVVRNSESVEVWHPNHTDNWDEAYGKLLKLIK
ncbi:MAG: rhamnulokinase [Oscillospiraceae bacterium]|nr:rhamnulokinase [Oscillospiraceae bacterium]